MKFSFVDTKTGERHDCSTPNNWEEITVDQFLQLELSGWDLKNPIKLLAILADKDITVLENAANTRKLYAALMSNLGWVMRSPPDWSKLHKDKYISFQGKKYRLPKDLEMESFGQKVLLSQKMEEVENLMELIPFCISVYLQPSIDGSFDNDRVSEIGSQVLKEPIINMFPIASFFFRKLIDYRNSGNLDLTLSL